MGPRGQAAARYPGFNILYRIDQAIPHHTLTVTVTWSDGVSANVDLAPVIAKGNVFAPLAHPATFVSTMQIAADRLGLEWPNRVDVSAAGLRFRAFSDEAEAEFSVTHLAGAA